jgi:type IV pilus assembly protein PilY1
MKTELGNSTDRLALARKLLAGATLAGCLSQQSMAALTDISNAPISSASTGSVPPNVLFILDNSGSMESDYMPDNASSWLGRVGGKSHLCNTIYYNPETTYLPPKQANGTDFPNSPISAAPKDGFVSSSSVNLGGSFPVNGSTTSENAHYYRWTGATPPTSTDCNIDDWTGAGSLGNWTKVFLTSSELQNFANWYSYYRTRMATMKSAAGRAFNSLNDSFRVGLITICPDDNSNCQNDGTTVKSDNYLKIDNFNASQKAAWYDMFYKQSGHSWTPLREALTRAGRHFAGKKDYINSGMIEDPIQYSCQQNFSILTTDGYWNYGTGKQLNGTTDIGQQDGTIGITPRPMYDGGLVTAKTVVTNKQERYRSRNSGTPSCSPTSNRKIYETRDQTVTTSTPQFGSPSTSTSTSATISINVCSSNPTTSTWTTINSETGAPTYSEAGGIGGTLADVAEYYYRTDLRGAGATGSLGTDVGTDNNVPASGTGPEDDKAKHQHMTTFTLGLGLNGRMTFDANYKTQTTGDFADIRAGLKGWPNPNPGSPGSSSSTDEAARIDDLWHAGVNGRGQYFSAGDPTGLGISLQTALSAIQIRLASAAAAATSTLELTIADRMVYTPKYTTSEWAGEIEAREIDLNTGAALPTVIWSAQSKLDAKGKQACDNRTIKLFREGAPNRLVDFTWNTQICDGGSASTGLDTTEQSFFTSAGTMDEAATLTQWGLMTDGTSGTANQKAAARGANLVNFIRGQRGLEGFAPNDADKLYRSRKHILGNIVNSEPVYVRKAAHAYADTGYDTFTASISSRVPMLYAAANDGMLHGFFAGASPTDPTGGDEAWAFIPRAVLPRLYKLADTNWATLHEYTVDGKPVSDDVFDPYASTWKTILVAGLNKGGRAYYALDVTDPANPKALWEFSHSSTCFNSGSASTWYSDCHLGYTYGNPVISKLTDGRWVVFVTSGYNNVNTPAQSGDGQGYLYVLEATTGRILYKIGTGAGDTTTPSGLSKIAGWVNNPNTNNTTLRVYGIDLLGNIWRFDVNDAYAPGGREATRLATVKDPSGNPQPITTVPLLSEAGNPPAPFVYVGTGRYLAVGDVTDAQVQSVYAIKDPLTTTAYADLRSDLQRLSLSTQESNRYVTCNQNCSGQTGWVVDLPDAGERVNVEMKLQLGTLVAVSNVPANTACEPGGYSYINFFDYRTGFSPLGAGQSVGAKFASALAVGINVVRLGSEPGDESSGSGKVITIGTDADGNLINPETPISAGAPSGKRVNWREIAF